MQNFIYSAVYSKFQNTYDNYSVINKLFCIIFTQLIADDDWKYIVFVSLTDMLILIPVKFIMVSVICAKIIVVIKFIKEIKKEHGENHLQSSKLYEQQDLSLGNIYKNFHYFCTTKKQRRESEIMNQVRWILRFSKSVPSIDESTSLLKYISADNDHGIGSLSDTDVISLNDAFEKQMNTCIKFETATTSLYMKRLIEHPDKDIEKDTQIGRLKTYQIENLNYKMVDYLVETGAKLKGAISLTMAKSQLLYRERLNKVKDVFVDNVKAKIKDIEELELLCCFLTKLKNLSPEVIFENIDLDVGEDKILTFGDLLENTNYDFGKFCDKRQDSYSEEHSETDGMVKSG